MQSFEIQEFKCTELINHGHLILKDVVKESLMTNEIKNIENF